MTTFIAATRNGGFVPISAVAEPVEPMPKRPMLRFQEYSA